MAVYKKDWNYKTKGKGTYEITKEVELFTWEKLDFVDTVKTAFTL